MPSRKHIRSTKDKITSAKACPTKNGNHAPLELGHDARSTENAHLGLTMDQPDNGTPPATTSASGTPGIRIGASHNENNTNPDGCQPGAFRSGSGRPPNGGSPHLPVPSAALSRDKASLLFLLDESRLSLSIF